MAALALQRTRLLSPLQRISIIKPLLFTAFIPAFLTAPRPVQWSLPSTLESLFELFPPILKAVPKKKISHSRKRNRSSNKGLKDNLNVVHCPGCGSPKLSHHLCPQCYSELSRMWKKEIKERINAARETAEANTEAETSATESGSAPERPKQVRRKRDRWGFPKKLPPWRAAD